MFGYIRPVLERLDKDQRDAYQSAYCGLCHALGARHGWLARFTLQYDFTFLAILLAAGEQMDRPICLRSPVHPLRKPRKCLHGKTLVVAADESMILTWHKLSDDVMDHGLLSGLPYRFLRWLFCRGYRRAAKAQPQFDHQVQKGLAALRQLEEARSPELDRMADAFASILSSISTVYPQGSPGQRMLEQKLYHLGRWIYVIDAWDELDEDKKKGRFNPLDARFQGRTREERDYVEATATHSVRLAASAVNLMELGDWRATVENVLYCGLPVVQSAVLDGRWKEMRQIRRKST